MRREEYACPNGCSLPPRKKQLREYSNGIYGFDFYDFTFCPCCGSLMPYSLKKLKGFFEVYNIHAALSDAVQLIYKSEFESAAREAFVAVENYLKKKSGLDLHGFDLATRALSFEIDKQTGEIKRAPLIAINDLKNESQRNEQDGIRYMLMGFFQGPRNLYQHNHIGSGVSNSISVIIEASFFLHLLDGHIPLLKSGKRCADSRIVLLKGGQDTAHRRLFDVRKMLRHSVSFTGGLRQFIKRRFLIVQIPSQILFLFFGEIADDVFLGWQLRRRRVKAVHPALQKIPLLL